FFAELKHTVANWDTSQADKENSKIYEPCLDDIKLLLPRVLIVGYAKLPGDFFVGIYGGLIAPESFGDAKDKVVKARMEDLFEQMQSIKLTDHHKTMLLIGIIAFLGIAFKYRKTSFYILMALPLIAIFFLTNTERTPNSEFFVKTKNSMIDIFIPAE